MKKLSMILNKVRGGHPDVTICTVEWERRLNGKKLAKFNVFILDLCFKLVKNEDNHCCRDWQKWKRNG